MYADDADFAADDRRSASGVAVMLEDTSIGSKSSTKKCVATTTCGAGYIIFCGASKEALFMRAVLILLQPELT